MESMGEFFSIDYSTNPSTLFTVNTVNTIYYFTLWYTVKKKELYSKQNITYQYKHLLNYIYVP